MEKYISSIAQLIADPCRAGILSVLMDGRAHTPGELARYFNISPQLMSNHIKKLLDAGMVTKLKSGRNHYYQLSGEKIAGILESLCVSIDDKIHQKRMSEISQELCYARSCYKHLAGDLAIKIFEQLKIKKYIYFSGDFYDLTESGYGFFNALGILSSVKKSNMSAIRLCLDWTERMYHLAGGVADTLLFYMLNEKILISSKHIQRALIATGKGKLWLKTNFNIF